MSADIDCVPDVEFRKKFCVPKRFDFRVWFPMHMHVQLQKMVGKLRSMDLIIEVSIVSFFFCNRIFFETVILNSISNPNRGQAIYVLVM